MPTVIDPRFGRGLPVIAASRVPVQTITDLWEAGETVEDIAYDFDMAPEQVGALCEAVVRLAARILPRSRPRTPIGGRATSTRMARPPHRRRFPPGGGRTAHDPIRAQAARICTARPPSRWAMRGALEPA
ncbi:DUF433 domain-containing protein [Streptomyces sp. NPDC102283]|uniref:DUF433 domain-containing protein n=1 Tax=Streptomyces sp. NPDC102283 TaxID=3366155 RepID=UPI0038034B0C